MAMKKTAGSTPHRRTTLTDFNIAPMHFTKRGLGDFQLTVVAAEMWDVERKLARGKYNI